MSVLQVHRLQVQFRSHETIIHAVNQVSFQLESGEIVGLVGESGSGKSVTMLAIMGLLSARTARIVDGEIWFQQRNLLQTKPDDLRRLRGRQIAMIFQDPMTSLNPVLTIGRQITEALQQHLNVNAKEARHQAIHWLDQVGIPDPQQRLDHYPHQFSGGMRQRVMIAMALCCQPALLIADEPTTALDVTLQAQIVALIKNFKQTLGMSIIWITHDLALLAGLADRVMVMYAGQIVEAAPVRELYDHPRHPYTIGLLQSIPGLLGQSSSRLRAIPGQPPDLSQPIGGCAFAPRCQYSQDACFQSKPRLEAITPSHQVACWIQPKS